MERASPVHHFNNGNEGHPAGGTATAPQSLGAAMRYVKPGAEAIATEWQLAAA